MTERSAFIDFIKGVSILGVLIIHVELLITAADPFFFAGQLADVLFRFAVPMFFGVQGYLTYKKYWIEDNWDQFFVRKLCYSFVPFLIWSSVYFFTTDVFNRRPEMDVLTTIVLGYSEVHLYFMVAYFGFVVMIPFIVEGGKRCSLASMRFILWTLIILHILILYTVEGAIWKGLVDHYYLQMDARLPLNWMSFYATGLLLALYSERKAPFVFSPLVFISGCIIYILFGWYLVWSKRTYFIYYTPYLIPLSALALFLLRGLYDRWSNSRFIRSFSFLGRHTFPIYLSHILWIKLTFIYIAEKVITVANLLLIFTLTLLASIAWIPIQQFIMDGIGKVIFALTRRKRIARKEK